MKLMSGSLLLPSGVGTQMLMVSRFLTTPKSVVALMRPALEQRLQSRCGDVLDVGLAAIDHVDFALIQVNTCDRESGLRELYNQGQPHVAQTHHTHLGLMRFDFLGEAFGMFVHEMCA